MSDLSTLLGIGTVTHFPKNETVFMQYSEGDCMYIVMDGSFGVYINSFSDFPVRVAEIGQGLFFGEMSVIDGSPRSATIIAEEEAAALVIGKDHFEALLEKSPQIGSTILNTLRGRANTTADAVRKAGKEPPPLPPLLRAVAYTDAKRGVSFMTMLAKYLRQMNDMLAKQSETQTAPVEISDRAGLIKLLPEGYPGFDVHDPFDSDNLLAGGKVVCPYCKNEFHARFPNFSKLSQKETRLDGRVLFKGFDVLWYTNIVCPNCCYTDSYQEFNKGTKPEKPKITGNQFENVEGFTGFASPIQHTLDEVLKSYYLRTICVEPMTTDPLRKANIWMRLYWLYGDNGVNKLAVSAAESALGFYLRYDHENDERFTTEEKMRSNAILGELYDAIHEKEKAMACFRENAEIGRMLNNDLMRQSLQRYKELKDAQ
jgi:CRP-like cAMP-binding protein/uncharacterized protein (DUF2225 family)